MADPGDWPRALIRLDSASLDAPLSFRVPLSPRVLRALALLGELQQFYGDGSFELAAPVRTAADQDEEFIDWVLSSAPDADTQEQLRAAIDYDMIDDLLGDQG